MAEKPLDVEYEWFKNQDIENGSFDVSFKINDQILHAHRRKLSPESNVFKEMFNQNPEYSEPIEISAVSFEGFKDFISYFYHLDIDFDSKVFFEVFELAEEYQVDPLIALFHEHLWYVNDEPNIFKICGTLNMREHNKHLKDFQSYFELDSEQEQNHGDFMKASKNAVWGILSLERSNDDNAEGLLFEAVVLWVETQANIMQPNNPDEYVKSEMATFLPKFDFKKMSFYFLKPFTDTYTSIFPSPEYIEDILRQSDKSIYKALCGNYYILRRPAHQNFTFLPSMMNYLTKHWSAEIYQKLIKTCKYFFYANRMMNVENIDSSQCLHTKTPGWQVGKGYSQLEENASRNEPTLWQWFELTQTKLFWINLELKKLWITEKNQFICIHPLNKDYDILGYVMRIEPPAKNDLFQGKYIHASDVKEFRIKKCCEYEKKPYLFDIFALSAPNLTKLEIEYCNIYFGSNALTLGDILSCTPNLAYLLVWSDEKDNSRPSLWNISRSTALGLPTLPKLEFFSLSYFPAFPDSNIMLQFVKNHNASFLFRFSNQDGYDAFKTAVFEAYSNAEERELTAYCILNAMIYEMQRAYHTDIHIMGYLMNQSYQKAFTVRKL